MFYSFSAVSSAFVTFRLATWRCTVKLAFFVNLFIILYSCLFYSVPSCSISRDWRTSWVYTLFYGMRCFIVYMWWATASCVVLCPVLWPAGFCFVPCTMACCFCFVPCIALFCVAVRCDRVACATGDCPYVFSRNQVAEHRETHRLVTLFSWSYFESLPLSCLPGREVAFYTLSWCRSVLSFYVLCHFEAQILLWLDTKLCFMIITRGYYDNDAWIFMIIARILW